jgi:hypothetical protein
LHRWTRAGLHSNEEIGQDAAEKDDGGDSFKEGAYKADYLENSSTIQEEFTDLRS